MHYQWDNAFLFTLLSISIYKHALSSCFLPSQSLLLITLTLLLFKMVKAKTPHQKQREEMLQQDAAAVVEIFAIVNEATEMHILGSIKKAKERLLLLDCFENCIAIYHGDFVGYEWIKEGLTGMSSPSFCRTRLTPWRSPLTFSHSDSRLSERLSQRRENEPCFSPGCLSIATQVGELEYTLIADPYSLYIPSGTMRQGHRLLKDGFMQTLQQR